MKVSVIVPVYNVENVLHYCIDSLLNQTYADFELILVDDGSSDGSGNLCDKYAAQDKRITVIHKENSGVSSARNTGIENAKGDYICFVDSDDYVSVDYLEELITTKEKYPDFDSVWCGFQTVSDYKGADLKINIFSEEEEYSQFARTDIMTLHEKWLSQMPWNKLYVLRIIQNNNIKFPEDLTLGEDLVFNLNYLDMTNGRIVLKNIPLYYYLRSDKGSLDNKFYPNLLDIYNRINSELLYYITKWSCSKKQLTLYYNSCFYSFEKVLQNTFRSESNIKNKYSYNKEILKSDEFKESLERSNCYINKFYRFAYTHYLYSMVRTLDVIQIIKKAKQK